MRLPLSPWKRRSLAVLTGLLIGGLYAPVALTEGAVRILPSFRRETPPAVASRIASAAGGSWRAVETAASDGVVLRENWLEAYQYLTPKAAASLNAEARLDNPFGQGKTQARSVVRGPTLQSCCSFHVQVCLVGN
mgnify:CR=1 FL=1